MLSSPKGSLPVFQSGLPVLCHWPGLSGGFKPPPPLSSLDPKSADRATSWPATMGWRTLGWIKGRVIVLAGSLGP